jgi:AAA ATPase domain
MKLSRARVLNFKSIDDSGWVDLDRVTCLVGKNESGKTAWLQALGKLKPIRSQNADFNYELEYPRKRLEDYKRIHGAEPATVVEAAFELSDAEVERIQLEFGEGAIRSREVVVKKDYANASTFAFDLDEVAIVRHLVTGAGLPAELAEELQVLSSISELGKHLAGLGQPQAAALLGLMSTWRDGSAWMAIIDGVLSPGTPEFVYFDDYSTMDGRVAIDPLKERWAGGQLKQADHTFLALLRLVGVDLEEFETLANQDWLISSLETAGNRISDEMFEFWSQNKDLRVEFKLLGPDPAAADEGLKHSNNLMVRIWNDRHRVSVMLDQRSRGFVWFFSFLVYFSELEQDGERELILLLDESGLGLHATAQRDFLRFIDERLAPKYQVIYTTHSPFMVEPTKLDRVRTVEDSAEYGTRVRKDLLTTSRETIFPLQAALGYELVRRLVEGDTLLVAGPADYLYLEVMSEHLGQLERASLDERWTIVPVGGLHNLVPFMALLHVPLNIAVIVGSSGGGLERIQGMVDRGLLSTRQLLPVSDITGTRAADVEDLFKVSFYLRLLQESGAASVTASELPQAERIVARGRIVPRVQQVLGHDFDHYRPARYLLEHPELLAHLDEHTLEPWERLIEEINARLLEPAGAPVAGAVGDPAQR